MMLKARLAGALLVLLYITVLPFVPLHALPIPMSMGLRPAWDYWLQGFRFGCKLVRYGWRGPA